MKKIIIILLSLLTSSLAYAQGSYGTEITGEDRTALMSDIEKVHRNLSTLSATFVQEKSSPLFTHNVVQKGRLHYKSPKQLRWEYTSPKATTVIFANGTVLLKDEKGATSNPNKMLGEMGNMIINTINGSFLKENPDFKTQYYKDKARNVTVVLTPNNKKIKTYYKNITITLDGSTHLANKVMLNEANGDVTTIVFSDKKANTTISDMLFK